MNVDGFAEKMRFRSLAMMVEEGRGQHTRISAPIEFLSRVTS